MTDIEERYMAAQDFINQGYTQKGFSILMELTESGYAPAEHRLGMCYYFGEGTIPNKNEAFKWFAKAANNNIAEAQYYLGLLSYLGECVDQDYEAAVEWFTKAAEQGEDKAQFYLGECYRYGFGVPADESVSRSWYEKAAQAGNETAKEMLDPKKAKKRDKQFCSHSKVKPSGQNKLNPLTCVLLGWCGVPYFMLEDGCNGAACVFCLINLILSIVFLIIRLTTKLIPIVSLIGAIICGIIGLFVFYFWIKSIFYAVNQNNTDS